jgi:hypothetical protein
LIIALLLDGGLPCFAQMSPTDSTTAVAATHPVDARQREPMTREKADSASVAKDTPWQPNPKRAGLYAALLPGTGQVYNRQYWKIPIVYAGLGAAGYFFVKNSNEYTKLRKAYVGRISARINHTTATDDYVGIYDETQLKQLQDDQNRIMNMTILYSSLAYAIQVLDAITSAHLRNFDISRDISFRVKPTMTPYGAGIGLAMGF